jgi:hypothetical protein
VFKLTATYVSRNVCRKSGTHYISTKDIDYVRAIKVCVNYIFIAQFSTPNVIQNFTTLVCENSSSHRGADEDSNLPEFIIVSTDKQLRECQRHILPRPAGRKKSKSNRRGIIVAL